MIRVMKQFLFLAILSVLPAQAIELKDIKGEWVGSHSETTNGKGIKLKATFKGIKRPDGGFVLKEKATSPLAVEATYTFAKDGKFKSVTIQSGVLILSTYSGTWRESNGVIKVSAKGTNGSLSATIKGSKTSLQVDGTFGKSKVTIRAVRK